MSKKILGFHIKSNDYFGTLATVLSLIRQNVENGESNKLNIKILKRVEEDLIFLQDNYKIINK